MWTRIYLLLALVRLYFAFSPSYIHPDENFQGPEVIAATEFLLILAGKIYGFPNLLKWEFTSEQPVRSVFPLWPTYGLPMVVLHWLWAGTSTVAVPARVVYYTLRVLMFMLSFVLEDWAIHELVESPRQRRVAVTLVASSYVTWTYQTHTFSNAVETILVLWSLVLVQRIRESKEYTSIVAASLLGVLAIVGTFNRITFPAFLIGPLCSLIPHILQKPMTGVLIALTGSMMLLLAVMTDTHFYRPSATPWATLLHEPVLAPYNALKYNLSAANLAEHGLHPRYTHLLANLPLLMAPALPLLLRPLASMRLLSAVSGLLALSALPHQEPRFLLPLVPLLLSSVQLPIQERLRKIFIVSWLGFNLVMGGLMGIFHQGGVVPAQLHLGSMTAGVADLSPLLPPGSQTLWWKTYSPPVWLANANASALETIDLMGMPAPDAWQRLQRAVGTCAQQKKRRDGEVVLVLPRSRPEIRVWVDLGGTTIMPTEQAPSPDALRQWPGAADLSWSLLGEERRHIGLDDVDFDHGVWSTLLRLVSERGLQMWRVRRRC